MDAPLYYGNSMRSVFTAGEKLQCAPVEFKQLQVGDIVAVKFASRQYVHRIIEKNDFRAITMGDNNLQPDQEVLTPESDFMRVDGVVDSHGKYRSVAGGAEGILQFHWHQKLQRRRQRANYWLSKLEKLFFWRIVLHDVREFGGEKCYYYRDRVIARRTASGAVIYSGWRQRIFFKVPGGK